MRINPQDTWHLATFTKETPKEQLSFFFLKLLEISQRRILTLLTLPSIMSQKWNKLIERKKPVNIKVCLSL